MKPLESLRRTVAPLLIALTLGACGGGGGGSSPATPAAKSDKAFKASNVAGSFASGRGVRAIAPPTSCTVQFGNDNTGDKGVVSFKTGSVATGDFGAYGADVANLDYAITSYDDVAKVVHGNVDFDLVNFTPNQYFRGTAHYHGTYTVDSSLHLNLAGSLSGPDAAGGTTTVSLGLAYEVGASTADLSGTYSGQIGFPNPLTGTLDTKPYSGASLAKVPNDGLHLNATIPFTNPVTHAAATIAFKGTYTRNSLSGSFNAASALDFGGLVTVPNDAVGQVYLSTTDGGDNFTGAFAVYNADGTPFTVGATAVAGTLTGKRGTTGGGSTSLKVGYYDGGVKRNGVLDGRIFKLNVVKASATTGANGSAIIVVGPTGGPDVGARLASVTGSGGTVTITLDEFTSTYTRIVLTGTVSGDALDFTYTATLLDGSTETGSFDQLAKVDLATPTLNATYSGSLTEGGTTNTQPFTGVFKATGNGTVTVTTASTVAGGIPLPPITGYIAGTSLALKDASETPLPSPYTGDTFYGNFDGQLSGNSITGKYVYFVNAPNGNTLLVQYGTLSLTK